MSECEKNIINDEFSNNCIIENTGNYIKYLKFCGITEFYKNRPIRKDIRLYYKKQPCCVCGNKSNLICDHKNDLYNDNRVLDTKTQLLSDFQSLCNSCNLQKRQINIQCINTKKRFGATNIPMLRIFNIDFISGNEDFGINDINAMVGTFWYDPICFMKYIVKS